MSEKITPEPENRLRQLFDAYLTGELSPDDQEELISGLGSPEGEELLKMAITREVDITPPDESLPIKAAITGWLDQHLSAGQLNHHVAARQRVHSMRRWMYAAAAAVVIGIAGTLVFLETAPREPVHVVTQRYKNDLPPGKDKAVLKLSDGRIVELNEKAAGNIPNQDGASINEQDGWVRYSGATDVHYNDLYTPVGAQIRIALADGTRVWLDASSSIHFPTAFPTGAREVTITGQAYFEVAPNARQPFIVHVRDQTIRVLGTHFNVNAYGSPSTPVKTTLEQGSVLVASGAHELKLAPGQQADGMKLRSNADLDEVLAWKNGEFRFNGASIEVIMDALIRWYGAEVVYKDQIKEEFVARIPRDVPVSKVLKYLEATGQVHFGIDGNKIIVMK